MRFSSIILPVVFVFFPTFSFAEIFLGEEPKVEKSSDAQEEPRDMPKLKSKRAKTSEESDSKGSWGGSLGVGAGAGFFAFHGSVSYGWNPYLGVSTSYDYERIDQGERYGEEHGPDVMLVLSLPNPTLVTPVAGAGPGYVYWTRSHNDQVFDEAQSPVMNYFGGVNVALTKNFGIAIHRRKTEFLRNRPVKYSDRETREDWARVDSNIGFYASF